MNKFVLGREEVGAWGDSTFRVYVEEAELTMEIQEVREVKGKARETRVVAVEEEGFSGVHISQVRCHSGSI